MFNIKWSALAGGFAFTLSLLIGLVNGAGIVALIRALIFGAVSFALGSAAHWIIGRFLPELLNDTDDDDGDGDDEAGSQVDISVDDDAEDSEDIDVIDSAFGARNGRAVSGTGMALDQDSGDRYTKEEIRMEDAAPKSAARPMEGHDAVDMLPDLDGMGAAFLPSSEDDDDDGRMGGQEDPPVRVNPSRNTATRAPGAGEDYSAREMAQAIQTILKREDKG